jgi:dihydropyrimidinase
MKFDTVVKNGMLVIPKEGLYEADIGMMDGKITGVFDRSAQIEGRESLDVEGKYVLPGIIDPHMHLGLTAPTKPDDFATETRASAVGGVTTVVSYVLKSESYNSYFPRIKELGEQASYIDFGLHFCTVIDDHVKELKHYINDFGVPSYKFFMSFRGKEGSYLGLTGIDDGLLFAVMEALSGFPNTCICPHAENIEVVWVLRKRLMDEGREGLAAWTESRPAFVEAEAVSRVLHFGEATGCGVYIPHLSSKAALEVVKRHRARSSDVYVETCTHYLTHTIDTEVGTVGKVNPPLRVDEDVEALWEGIADGTIDSIGSDHAPRTFDKKGGNIWETAAGFSGVPTMLPVMLSEGVDKRGLSLERLVEVMCYNPARILGLYPRKGTIRIGSDADLTVVDLDLEKEVRVPDLETATGYSIYEGWRLKGWPVLTMVRGQVVMKDGKIVGEEGHGTYLPRAQKSHV